MSASQAALIKNLKKGLPWLFLILGLLYFWRPGDWFNYIPSYGDTLEVTWGSQWYLSHLTDPAAAFHYPLTYYPAGWDVRTFPQGLGVFLVTVPLTALGGAAFAVNAAGILAIVTAFAGVYFLLNRHVDRLSASLGAFLYAFWDFRYLAHMNILLGTALLPWMLFFLENGRTVEKRPWHWYIVTGMLWGLAANMQLYFVWLGALTALLWLFGQLLARRLSGREFLSAAVIVTAAFLIVVIPSALLFLQATATGTGDFDIYHLNSWGASLNSLFIPSPAHPLLKPLSRTIYSGALGEAGRSNVGLFTALAVLIGFWRIPHKRRLAPIFMLTVAGLVLGLGPFLKWNSNALDLQPMIKLNEIIWPLIYKLKPALVRAPQANPGFSGAIPLPEFFMAAIIPFWEGARTVSRYILVGGLGFFLLVAFSIDNIKYRWLKYTLIILVLVEGFSFPFSLHGVPLKAELHGAYQWLREQEMPVGAIIDLQPVGQGKLSLYQDASILVASSQHGKFNVSGTGSVWPEQAKFLRNWLNENPIAAEAAAASKLLASYDIRYVLIHMHNEFAPEIVEDLDNTQAFHKIGCFEPPSGISPWNKPICIVENLAFLPGSGQPLFYQNGWGGLESWGIWGTGKASRLDWIATEKRDYQLTIKAEPYCIPDSSQKLELYANGESVFNYKWAGCEPIQESLLLPQDELEIGWNSLVFKYAYAVKPAVITEGEVNDLRDLAVAFTEITIK